MKKEAHPNYHPVVFKDTSSDFAFLAHSTLTSKETFKWTDGKEYPVFKMEISSASHPFYTGSDKIIDAEGRVEKFQKKFKLRSTISSTRKTE